MKGAGLIENYSQFVAGVTINTAPGVLAMSADAFLERANDPRLGYTARRTVSSSRGEAACCDVIVEWDPVLGIAPVKIRAVTPRGQKNASFKRWLVVQLPPPQKRLLRLPTFVEYGDGVTCHPSGWLVFATGKDVRVHVGARTFGRTAPGVSPCSQLQPSPRAASRKGTKAPIASPRAPPLSPASSSSSLAASRDDANLTGITTLTLARLERNALGSIADVQRQLAIAAVAGTPLNQVAPEALKQAVEVRRSSGAFTEEQIVSAFKVIDSTTALRGCQHLRARREQLVSLSVFS